LVLQHDIAKAGDAELRKYCEQTPEEDITEEGMREAMLMGVKDKTEKLKVKLRKMTAVANPSYGDRILQEVCAFHRSISWSCSMINVQT
jgi:hypothetical protein